jgi:hypothetical protein
MDDAALLRVVNAAELALTSVPETSDKWIELNRDIREAYQTLSCDM